MHPSMTTNTQDEAKKSSEAKHIKKETESRLLRSIIRRS